ncbi:hypothetical protein [Methylobacterium sp. Gmos1]
MASLLHDVPNADPGHARQEDIASVQDFDIEMANLTEEDTGVPGTIYISTTVPRHAARVKWYEASPKNPNVGFIALSIEAEPHIRVNKLGKNYSMRSLDLAKAWIAKNETDLVRFWNEGSIWNRRQMNVFLDGLKKV